MTDRQRNGLKLMGQMGGGFAKALAEAWQRADLENSARLMMGFGAPNH